MQWLHASWAVPVLLTLASSAADAQGFAVRREQVLPISMPAQKLPAPRPVTAVGIQVPADAATSPSVRAHLRVDRADPASRWTIVATDPDGTVERIAQDSPKVGSNGFWTDEFAKGPIRVALVVDAGSVDIVVDQQALAQLPSVPQAIVGQDELRAITDPGVPARVRQRAPGIARLKFMTPEGQAVCSGFLVGRDLFMTNEHCIATEEDARSATVEFGFDSDAAVPLRFRVIKVEATSFGLDYSLLRLSGQPPSRYSRLFFSVSAPRDANPLYIVQHPGGEPKQASFFPDCLSGDLKVSGRETDTSDFGHLCDTLGGSSGAPVIDWATGTVVGLHHLGFRAGIDKPQNQAVYIAGIIADLKAKVSPAIYTEITRRP